MEVTGAIQEIKMITGFPHGREYLVETPTGNAKLSVWGKKVAGGTDIKFRIGDYVSVDAEEKPYTNKYGKTSVNYSCFVTNMIRVGEEDTVPQEPSLSRPEGVSSREPKGEPLPRGAETPQPDKAPEMTKGDWDEKERRSHRRACLAIASGLLKDEDKQGTPEQRAALCVLGANTLLDYVYNDMRKTEPAQPVDEPFDWDQ